MSIFYDERVIQFFLLAELYLLLGAAVLLADLYGVRFVFMLNIRSFCFRTGKTSLCFFAAGLCLCLCLLFSPVSPGPVIIGDLLPAVCILVEAFMFLHPALNNPGDFFSGSRDRQLGRVLFAVALLHFLFPSVVLL